jgi:hypothetical protein
MPGRGGYIGFNRVPAATAVNSAASGVWTLREAESLKRGGTWPVAFVNPSSIAGLQLWLDASDATTLFNATSGGSLVAADGGVARWEDKSGNARHATQSTSANRPARKTAVQGGLDVLRFDGTDDFLQGSSTPGSGNARTVFVVSKSANTSGGELLQIGIRTQAEPIFLARLIYISPDTYVSGDLTSNVLVTNTQITINSFGLFTFREISSDRSVSVRRNQVSSATTGTLGLFNGSAGFSVGARTPPPLVTAGFWNGDIAEIVTYDSALSDTDRAAVEAYLLAKWGIT